MAAVTQAHSQTPSRITASAPRTIPDIIALIHLFNEELILEPVLQHLASQNIGFYILDNYSTDASLDIARSFQNHGLVGIEQFPEHRPPGEERLYNLAASLHRKSQLALDLAQRGARWLIHYDADEIRESPWPGLSLRDGLLRVQREGCNTIDHVVVNFVPTDESFTRGTSPQSHFTRYLPDTKPTRHAKAWIQGPHPVDLASTGGHFVKFPGGAGGRRKLYPIPFIIRHYPLLNTAHAQRKILKERKPRYSDEGLAQGWHRHYNDASEQSSFVYAETDPRLQRWDESTFKNSLLTRQPEKRGLFAWLKSR